MGRRETYTLTDDDGQQWSIKMVDDGSSLREITLELIRDTWEPLRSISVCRVPDCPQCRAW